MYRWQNRLGYPRSIMMQKLVEKKWIYIYIYIYKSQKILQSSNYFVLLVHRES